MSNFIELKVYDQRRPLTPRERAWLEAYCMHLEGMALAPYLRVTADTYEDGSVSVSILSLYRKRENVHLDATAEPNDTRSAAMTAERMLSDLALTKSPMWQAVRDSVVRKPVEAAT